LRKPQAIPTGLPPPASRCYRRSRVTGVRAGVGPCRVRGRGPSRRRPSIGSPPVGTGRRARGPRTRNQARLGERLADLVVAHGLAIAMRRDGGRRGPGASAEQRRPQSLDRRRPEGRLQTALERRDDAGSRPLESPMVCESFRAKDGKSMAHERLLAATLGWSITLASCSGGSTTMTMDAAHVSPPRGPRCDFQVLSAPARGFTEIGTIDIRGGDGFSHRFRSIAELKEEIRPYVCRAGGDAALAWSDGDSYTRATVLKRAENAIDPAPVGPNAAQDGGCKYDTQCKGDRICVAGTCQEPLMPSASPAAQPTAPTATAR
jgi:hypothetical protein